MVTENVETEREAAEGPARPDGSPDEAPHVAEARGDAAGVGARADESRCPSCEEALVGDYCHRCGEKRAAARDLTLRHFIAEAVQEFTSVEHSKIFRTARALLFRPGRLTREWAAGRRNLYLKPLNLCLLVFALNLFAYSATKRVSMFDLRNIAETEQKMLAAQGVTRPPVYYTIVDRIAARKGTSREAVIEAVNDRWSRNASFVQIPEILAFALLLRLLYLFSRRHFVEHVVFSLHFLSFAALSTTLMWPIYFALGIVPSGLNMLVAVGKFLLDVAYLFVAVRVFYRDTVGWALLKAPVIFAGYFVIYVMAFLAALFASIAAVAK